MYRILFIVAALTSIVSGQTSLQKMVDAEHAFAQMAAEKGTKAAFLATMTDDAVVFNPETVNARANWILKGDSKGLLAWAPNFADISSDGAIGYTTGNWEFRPKGKDDMPVAFGDFVTIWKRQVDGTYNWIIDIGTSHDKPASFSSDWRTSAIPRDKVATRSDIFATVKQFAVTAAKSGLGTAYTEFAGDDIRANRQNKKPILGKTAAMAEAASAGGFVTISTNSLPVTAGDLGYLLTEYSRVTTDGKSEKGNLLQVWKLYRGKWHLELDIFSPIPSK